MNKFQIFSIVSIFIVSCATVSVQASNVILDTTIINFSASGSPNTISGSWDTSPLIVSDGAMIDYFTVELTEMNSDFGKPESISFGSYLPGNSRSINFSWNTYTSVADTVIGDIGVINSGSTILHAWDFMNRLVEGNTPQTHDGNFTACYTSGGDSASISGQVLVQVYGEAAVVPIPSTISLLGLGLLGLAGISRKKHGN